MREGEWVEVPAHRIYITTHELYYSEFDRLGKHGLLKQEGEETELVIRKRDQKIFKLAPFQPIDGAIKNLIALVEA